MPTQRLTWTRDEIILATDLYLRVDRRVPDSTLSLAIQGPSQKLGEAAWSTQA